MFIFIFISRSIWLWKVRLISRLLLTGCLCRYIWSLPRNWKLDASLSQFLEIFTPSLLTLMKGENEKNARVTFSWCSTFYLFSVPCLTRHNRRNLGREIQTWKTGFSSVNFILEVTMGNLKKYYGDLIYNYQLSRNFGEC